MAGGQQRALLRFVSRSMAASARSCYFSNGFQNRAAVPFSMQLTQAHSISTDDSKDMKGAVKEVADVAKGAMDSAEDMTNRTDVNKHGTSSDIDMKHVSGATKEAKDTAKGGAEEAANTARDFTQTTSKIMHEDREGAKVGEMIEGLRDAPAGKMGEKTDDKKGNQ